jgi:type IV pilus assembly protein PilB
MAEGVSGMPVGESLVKNGVITKEQLEKALEEQKKHPEEKIGQILLRLGYLPVEDLESLL